MPELAAPAEAGMRVELSPTQREARAAFRRFAAERVVPEAGAWDRAGAVPREVIAALVERGWLGAPLPAEAGGGAMAAVTYGLLTEEIARGCSSLRSLLTVHDMVSQGLWRWGSRQLKAELFPALGRGERLAALALSEPEVGSDAAHVRTTARRDGDDWVLDGRKKWITFGRIADLFLVLAQAEGGPAAFAVPADAPGLERRPLDGVVGTRASMLAELHLDGCRVPAHHLVGRPGFGFSHVVTMVLDHGRYSVAWGSVGVCQACLDACLDYTAGREQFGVPLADHQLVRRELTDLIADTRAARLLCYRAGWLRETGDPASTGETLVAKYFASRAAVRAANAAVQLHGANGLSQHYPLERYLRDAKVLEIIEGSSQIQQITIPVWPPSDL
ncbi:MAG TPA: acyl-CoA dehydrogenase family protein [Thermoanaerobaculia bacterium]|nr:acyl-CoA dehydrogenase family protein [Thermoanaerobaculia bacterium]